MIGIIQVSDLTSGLSVSYTHRAYKDWTTNPLNQSTSRHKPHLLLYKFKLLRSVSFLLLATAKLNVLSGSNHFSGIVQIRDGILLTVPAGPNQALIA